MRIVIVLKIPFSDNFDAIIQVYLKNSFYSMNMFNLFYKLWRKQIFYGKITLINKRLLKHRYNKYKKDDE